MGRFRHLMTSDITIANPSTIDDYGEIATYGSQATQKAHVEGVNRHVFGINGERLQINHLVITDTEINSRARIWLPWDDITENDESRTIIKTDRVRSHKDGYTIYEYNVT